MARPAQNAPHGGGYDQDDETPDDRPASRPSGRVPPKPAGAGSSQPPARKPADARPSSARDDMPWQELNEPIVKDEVEAAPPEETSPLPVAEDRAAAEEERRERARRKASEEKPVAVPLPEPVYPPPLKEDASWASDEAPAELKSEGSAKPASARKRRGFDVAGTIYLILLALVAASLSAAVVLFLF